MTKTKFIFIFSLLIIGFGFAKDVLATDYYVSPDGGEVWPNCTTENNPCEASNTSKDFLNVVAGDTVYFLDGVYPGIEQRDPVGAYREAAWFALNSGSATNPIEFRALNRRGVTLEGLKDTVDMGRVAVIGSKSTEGEAYVTWSGFVVTAVNLNGEQIMGGINLYYSEHYTIDDCEIIGVEHALGGAYNIEGVRIEGSNYTTVKNCYIHGWKEATLNHNTSGLKTYWASHGTLSNNVFEDNYTHIYFKGGEHTDWLVNNNFIKGGNEAILYTLNSASKHNFTFDNNLAVGMRQVFGDDGAGPYYSNDIIIKNNTSYTHHGGWGFPVSEESKSPTVYNNIVYVGNDGVHILTRKGIYDKLKQSDHNLFYPNVKVLLNRYGDERIYDNLNDWQKSLELETETNFGCELSAHPGCGSLNIDPLFANTSGEMNQISDFYLSNNSLALNAGRDGVNMGADIDLIGIQNDDSIQLLVIRADVNQDSQLNTTDAILILRNSLGLDMIGTTWQSSATTGDVNCDNVSNSTDAMLLLRYSLGLDMSGTDWCE